jgi:purine catabolism regulator
MLTVRELIRDLDVEVVGGEEGFEAPVRWVHISELTDPTPWLAGGEVLLTTGMALGTAEAQRELVAHLAGAKAAAIGFGTGFAHKTVPKALRDAAAKRGLPLFEVPYDTPFIAITEKAFTRLVNEQYRVLQRSIAAHQRLERIVLSEQGLDGVLAAIAALIGGAALCFDARGELLGRRGFKRSLDESSVAGVAAELRERRRTGERRVFAPSPAELAGRALALPVAATGSPNGRGEQPLAWLVAAKDDGALTEFDRLCLHQAVTVVALELLRRRVAEDTERRLAGDVLSALVTGEVDGDELARRLEPFGLADQTAAIVLSVPRSQLGAAERALRTALREQAAGGGLAAVTEEFACALVPGTGEEELLALAERIRAAVASDLGAETLIGGVGRPVAGGDARRTFHEARCALEARQLAGATHGNGHGTANGNGRPASLATYQDLGSFQLLLALQDDDALRLFCDSILGPIESGDGHYGGELMRSLEAFIEENGQWERAAKRLFCHRHTLRYRMRKVEELTGRDLSSARDRIEFWLALRGRELTKEPA